MSVVSDLPEFPRLEQMLDLGGGPGPTASVYRFLPMALAGKDVYLKAGAIADAMARAGLKTDDSRSVETPMGPLLLDIGRAPAKNRRAGLAVSGN